MCASERLQRKIAICSRRVDAGGNKPEHDPESCGAALPRDISPRLSSPRLLRGDHAQTRRWERNMSKAGLDNRHRNKDGEISHKHGNTLVSTLRKIYGMSFAAGYPGTEKLSEVLLHLNETSLSQLRRDHQTGHLEHKISNAEK
jgi:hypothetical protein